MPQPYLLLPRLCFLLLLFSSLTATAADDSSPSSLRRKLQGSLAPAERVATLEKLCRAYGAGVAPDSALEFGEQGMALARRLNDPQLLLTVMNTLAVTYGRAHLQTKAMRLLREELTLAERYHNPQFEAAAHRGLSNIYSEQENLTETERHLRLAVQAAKRTHQPIVLADAQSQLGLLLMQRGHLTESEALLQSALAVHERAGTREGQAYILSFLAEGALSRKRYPLAASYAQRAIRLLPTTDAYALACLYDLLNRAALAEGQPRQAVTYGTQAVAYAHTAGVPATESDMLRSLIAAYDKLGDYGAAFRLQRQLSALNDSVFKASRDAETTHMLAQFDAQKRQQKIRLLTQQTRIQQLEAGRQRARIRLLATGAGGLGLAVLVFGIFYWKLSRSRQRLASSEHALRELNQTKDLLMSVVGHDLRSPISGFQQVAPILRQYAHAPEPPELLALADEVEASATQLALLFDNLLHWARAQARQVVNRPAPVAVADAVQQVVNLYAPIAAAKHLSLVARVPAMLPAAWVDPALLATILRNLVSNAVKFTPAGGSVTVQVSAAADSLRVTVRDTGVGMAPAQLATLFESANGRSTKGTAGEAGTGLGLAVCQSFARLLGSELRVSSEPGQGTCFDLQVPVQPADIPAPAAGVLA